MNLIKRLVTSALLIPAFCAQAELSVKVDEPKQVGNKAIVKLTLKNNYAEKVESARAQIFLMDESGKMAGQATRWVIGGTKDKPGLAAGATATYNFVVESNKPFFTTKVSFSRIILNGGKVITPQNGSKILD